MNRLALTLLVILSARSAFAAGIDEPCTTVADCDAGLYCASRAFGDLCEVLWTCPAADASCAVDADCASGEWCADMCGPACVPQGGDGDVCPLGMSDGLSADAARPCGGGEMCFACDHCGAPQAMCWPLGDACDYGCGAGLDECQGVCGIDPETSACWVAPWCGP